MVAGFETRLDTEFWSWEIPRVMISAIEQQPAGSGVDLVRQVEEIFSPTGILSRAKNFEYRPQQQEMAVAVARALERREHLAVEAGTGVGKSLAYLVPAILFAVAEKKKASSPRTRSICRSSSSQKDLPMLEAVLPVKFAFTMLKGRGNYLCSRRLHKAMLQAEQLVHLAGGRGIEAHLRVEQEDRGRQLVRFRDRAGSESLVARLLGTRALLAENLRPRLGLRERQWHLFLPARPPPDSFLGCAGVEPHALLHPAARRR